MNEIRNELLTILNLQKNCEDDRDFYIKLLLERFEYDLDEQLEEVKRKEKTIKDNIELLEYVRKELGIKGNG